MSDVPTPAASADGRNAHGPRCLDGHCITCSDEGVPMRVVSIPDPGLAVCIAEDGRRSEVLTALVEEIREGDTLLVHAGAALLRLDTHPTAGP